MTWRRYLLHFLLVLTVGSAAAAYPLMTAAPGQSALSDKSSGPQPERPLIVRPGQGEVRRWRPLANTSAADASWGNFDRFTIKIDRRNGGSPDFWFGTEDMPPGAEISFHRHLHEDEIVYIPSGIAHAHVGAVEGEATAGSIIFIPRNTWVSIKNVGKTTIPLLFAFNAPGFDRYMRCESVPADRKPPVLSAQEDARCSRLGDVEYR